MILGFHTTSQMSLNFSYLFLYFLPFLSLPSTSRFEPPVPVHPTHLVHLWLSIVFLFPREIYLPP